jgi:FAD/FMN-containing dehydrogenase
MKNTHALHPKVTFDPVGLQNLRARLQGSALVPGDDGYDRARLTWDTATFDQHPALIVMPAITTDVLAAVTFAREHGLPIAVQGGGHGHPYPADGAILVNFAQMTGLQINAGTSTARVEPGVKWAEVIQAASPFGLAPLNGFAATVGVVGYLLGGGFGWLVRQYGLGASSMRSLEFVTADGRLLQVNENSSPDLFWGLRGGGGNFGIVTSLEFALYPVKEVFGGQVIYPVEQGKAVLNAYLQWVKTVPETLTSTLRIMHVPPLPTVPPMVRGKTVVMIAACSNGSQADGEAVLHPMRTLGTPLLDTFAQMPYSQIATIANDPVEAPPLQFSTDHKTLRDFTPSAIDAIFAVAANPASGVFNVQIRHFGGVLARIPAKAMAASLCDVNFSLSALAAAPTTELLETGKRSIMEIMRALKPDTSAQALLNMVQ